MPPSRRDSSKRTTGAASTAAPTSPPKPDQYEQLYNAAVQSFVRRDHARTQNSLKRLLDLTRALPRDPVPWYDLTSAVTALSSSTPEGTALSGDEWVTKTLKLAISANASLYSDPPKTELADMAHLLPPAPPTAMLEHIRSLCAETYAGPLLPPALVSTFLLAALKLRPAEPALAFAHQLAEDWLAALPDAFVLAIASDPHPRGQGQARRKRIEQAREGYLKVIELFVGEILAREGEWEMARGLLEGEMVMGSKKKEALYRHLRAQQTSRSKPASPATSGLLPSPTNSAVLSPSPNRPRSSSASTSSSEATARPAGTELHGLNALRSVKGKGRDTGSEAPSADSTIQPPKSESTTVPDKIYVRSPPTPPPQPLARRGTLSLLPAALVAQLDALWRSGWVSKLLFPLPVLLVLFAVIRRRQRARAGVQRDSIAEVRARLMRARVQGLGPWLAWFVKWWADKIAGVWKLGTTITYM